MQVGVPFTYKPKIKTDSTTPLDSLVEFAANGEISSLVTPYASHIGETDSEGNTVLHISAKNSQSFALKLLLSAIPQEQKNGEQ
ncbi:hypothetical protein OESDEN_14055 [Oesophagostomum dentatum]|uniref:Uncharacterized protein n=1 Tax=Oesophagostomum dentatum TaxID=61180 RepID=A0A0B1SLM5_OESDE|nr:hypothetical protein OESDEN_14055 [Oesophagostomum dentatum]